MYRFCRVVITFKEAIVNNNNFNNLLPGVVIEEAGEKGYRAHYYVAAAAVEVPDFVEGARVVIGLLVSPNLNVDRD